jgi:hypothetical protein
MKYIAHRGLIEGPNKDLENRPEQIKRVLDMGYDCEIDLWRIGQKWFLGHDEPQYEVDEDFVKMDGLWIHCKNLEALYMLTTSTTFLYTFFWHQNDDFTLTSDGYIWTYPNKDLSNVSIAVMPELYPEYWDYIKKVEIAGVCTDYVEKIKNEISTMPLWSA